MDEVIIELEEQRNASKELADTLINSTDIGMLNLYNKHLARYKALDKAIAYLRASQKPETSGGALHIGSVGGNEAELCATCQSPLQDNFREGRFCVACNVKFG